MYNSIDMRFLILISFVFSFAACKGQTEGKLASSDSRVINGFEIVDPTVPINEIYQGTPTRDAIPSIDDPKYLKAENADFMNPQDKIIGLKINNDIKAFPIKILTWHEIVNDVVGGMKVVISYCPLCDSAYVFEREINGKTYTFGVSGLLYNSNVVMYDHQTETLWSQVKSEAISGELKGTKLPQVDATSTTWGDWVAKHPSTEVLSKETGHNRNYEESPYGTYSEDRDIMFPVDNTSDRYHPKDFVAGIEIDGNFKAYPFPELRKAGTDELSDQFMGKDLTIHFNEQAEQVTIEAKDGTTVPVNRMYWFAWYAFHPNTEVFTLEE